MCGRYTLIQPAAAIASFGLNEIPNLEPRYNIAPTQLVPAILQSSDHLRQFQNLRWGLIPFWAKEPSIGARLINARAETVSEKPSFRSAFRHRRCLIITDGFYEWQRQGSKKQPFYFRLQNGQPFAFAGLWEHWKSSDTQITSCTIVTTQANEILRPIHDRMPVILNPKDYELWLDPTYENSGQLQQLLQPYASEAMISYPVSTKVNSPSYNSPECINSL